MLHMYSFLRGFLISDKETPELKESPSQPSIYALTLQSELMKLGYIMSYELMLSLSDARAIEIYKSIIANIKFLIGDDGEYEPFYKNFPESVISKSDYELLVDQVSSYLCVSLSMHLGEYGAYSYTPEETEKVIDESIIEPVKYKLIRKGYYSELHTAFTTMVSCNNSLTTSDKLFIKWFTEQENGNVTLPEAIPFKETLCFLHSLGIKNLPIKTPTDVLRIAEYMSIKLDTTTYTTDTNKVGDVLNNMSTVKFRKFTRPERRELLDLLERTSCSLDDMYADRLRWIRLGEIIHPGQYAKAYPKAFKAFNALRNEKIKTWNKALTAALNECFKTGVFSETLEALITQRPGE
ncbi:MAG: hypothetical protein ACRDD8_14830, partial [Bacteroidales bacterium]